MSKLPLTLVIKDYDHLAPLACGDVVPEGIDLRLERDTANALVRSLDDPAVGAGEYSFSKHLIRLANGDRSIVGLPAFVTRAFRHRCFFVRRDGGLKEFKDLEGKRIGTNSWPDTGNTWSRAALREQGVRLETIDWLVGSVNGEAPKKLVGIVPLNVKFAPAGRLLSDMLVEGDLDALMCPMVPTGFYAPDSPIVRLTPDFRRAERDYYLRTGIFPPHHIAGVRREVFEKNPWVLRSLYHALELSKTRWQDRRRQLTDTTPWLLAEIEETTALIGGDWSPYGVEPNQKVIQALCQEQFAQKLVSHPVDPAIVFAEFEEVSKG